MFHLPCWVAENPSKSFCLLHVTFLTCSQALLVSVSLRSCSGRKTEELSLIISVYSPLLPRPSLKLNFYIVPAIQAWNWIFTRIFNPEGKKWYKAGDVSFLRAMAVVWSRTWLSDGGLLALGASGLWWGVVSRLTHQVHRRDRDHQEICSQHYHPLYHIFFSEIGMQN